MHEWLFIALLISVTVAGLAAHGLGAILRTKLMIGHCPVWVDDTNSSPVPGGGSTQTMLSDVHHINILVRDLDAAVSNYGRLFGNGAAIRERLDSRGVETARYCIGHTWIVLVMPTNADGPIAKHLAAHGEGVFLLSFSVRDLDRAALELQERGARIAANSPLRGFE